MAAQNNAVRTNYIKARIDKTQQNSRCRVCGDRDETINQLISEYSRLAQKEYEARHNWVGKVIHCELCKKFKFDRTNKWYMHNLTSVLGNYTHKVLRNFEIQTDHLFSARRPDFIIIIIIIMSRYQHGYAWPSLATRPYRPLLPADLQGYIPYRHRAAVCRFELVVLLLLVHVKGSTGVHHLWARPYFSNSILYV